MLVMLAIAPFLVAAQYGHITSLEALLLAGPAALVVFGLLGTWLPAVVTNGDRRVSAAFARGRQTFFYTVPRLFLGPGVVQTILLTGAILLPLHGILAGEVFGAAGFNPIDLISLPLFYALRGFLVAILAVVLSRAYRIVEPA
jgi:hypothetical protein